jgi:hypothetical protein
METETKQEEYEEDYENEEEDYGINEWLNRIAKTNLNSGESMFDEGE